MIARNYNLIKGDWKIIGRDPMLIMSMFAPILFMLIAVFLFPLVSDFTRQSFNFPLEEWFPVGRLFFLSIIPMLLGMVYGFILLDERDGGIISYLAITPVGKSGYFTIRMLMPVCLSFIMSIAYLYITGFDQMLHATEIVIVSFIISLEAPLILLILGAFADNKVEGIAISKGFSIIILPMLVDYFLVGNWRWVLSISPMWWIGRAVFCEEAFRGLYLGGAALIHIFYIGLLYRKFEKRFG